MPTIEQIRAARALIGWSQGDLADRSDLSQTGVARIENGSNYPNSMTLDKIVAAFDKADIEFIGESGVKKRTGEVRTLTGQAGFREFMDSVYTTARDVGGEICVFNSLYINFHKWCGKDWYKIHAERMAALGYKINMKVIVSEGDDNFIGEDFAEYRWFPKNLWNDQTIYSYGDYLAFLNFTENDVYIMILKQSKFTEGFRVLFNISWEEVAQLPQSKK